MSAGRRRAATAVTARMGDLGMTQQELAERASVDPKTVGDLIRSRRWPIARTRARIEKALGWPAGELARISTTEDEPPQLLSPRARRVLREELSDEDYRRVVGLAEGTLVITPREPGEPSGQSRLA